MWEIEPTEEYERRLRRWPKKYRREMAAMLSNVDTLLKTLRRGAKIQEIHFGFMHRESCGVKGIDQKGGGQGLKECRLYVYPDEEPELLRLLTVGDKESQSDDVQFCSNFVKAQRHEQGEKI